MRSRRHGPTGPPRHFPRRGRRSRKRAARSSIRTWWTRWPASRTTSSSGSAPRSADAQGPHRRRRPVHPEADRHHARGCRGLRASPGERRRRGGRHRRARGAGARVPRHRHAAPRRNRGVCPYPGPALDGERDHRDADRDLAHGQRAACRGGRRGPVPHEAVQPARPAAAGGSDRRQRLRAYLGLGSNVGDRRANLTAAAEKLGALRVSSIYETAPQGEVLDQRDFLNAVAEVETELGPEELLAECKRIEAELGRRAGGVRHGPRPIDIDILLLGDIEYQSERLRIPHRDLETRRFVLEPLKELAPELVSADRLAAVADQRVQRVEGTPTPSWRE